MNVTAPTRRNPKLETSISPPTFASFSAPKEHSGHVPLGALPGECTALGPWHQPVVSSRRFGWGRDWL